MPMQHIPYHQEIHNSHGLPPTITDVRATMLSFVLLPEMLADADDLVVSQQLADG